MMGKVGEVAARLCRRIGAALGHAAPPAGTAKVRRGALTDVGVGDDFGLTPDPGGVVTVRREDREDLATLLRRARGAGRSRTVVLGPVGGKSTGA